MAFILDRELGRRLTPLAFKLYRLVVGRDAGKKLRVTARDIAASTIEMFEFMWKVVPRKFKHNASVRYATIEWVVIACGRYPECMETFKYILEITPEILFVDTYTVDKCMIMAARYGNITQLKHLKNLLINSNHPFDIITISEAAIDNNHICVISFLLNDIICNPINVMSILAYSLIRENITIVKYVREYVTFDLRDYAYFTGLIVSHCLVSIKYCISSLKIRYNNTKLAHWIKLSETNGTSAITAYLRSLQVGTE